jgi:predicted dehydrogenase
MINAGVVGYGYWGPNLVRNFAETDGYRLHAVCDARPERLALARKRHPSIVGYTDAEEMITDATVDLVAISTPVSTHFPLAMLALEAGKHVLIEKPMALNTDECARLMDAADRRKLVMMVDHTFVYTSAVRKMKELVREGSLGEIYYYDSVRVNLGLFRHDVNVIWDLAVHDLAIMAYVLPMRPVAVSATGLSHVPGSKENIAYLTMFFNEQVIAHVHANWLAPVKVRSTLLGGSRRMIIFDDLEPSEKIKVYDRGITVNSNPEKLYEVLIDYRTGDMWSPKLDTKEALGVEIAHLRDCIEGSSQPETGGQAGFDVVSILEASTKSLQNHGQPVKLAGGAVLA